ncbi:MAG: hypothetical protein M3463_11915 [Verrucomicrobiota bacterium]|nr:hypothetical protein [Verrucomicrobiota bacterium]
MIAVAQGIVEQVALKLRVAGVLPEQEQNDSLIIAEAALIGCTLLLSSDNHLTEANEHPRLRVVLKECDVERDFVIATPRRIAQQFFLKK